MSGENEIKENAGVNKEDVDNVACGREKMVNLGGKQATMQCRILMSR